MEKSGAFDCILLETTGLADPGNLAPLFWVDDGLGSTIYLDGIVTLVDAKNIVKSLSEPSAATESTASKDASNHANSTEQPHDHAGPHLSIAHLQISHADVIVINKADLVSEAELAQVQDRIRSINMLAKIHVTEHSQVPKLEGVLLDLHAYDHVDADAIDFASKGHSHLDSSISTITLSLPPLSESQMSRLDEWLRSLLWARLWIDHPDNASQLVASTASSRPEIHRTKGRLLLQDGGVRLLQGVRDIFEFIDSGRDEEAKEGKIVLIGKNVRKEELQKSLNEAVLA